MKTDTPSSVYKTPLTLTENLLKARSDRVKAVTRCSFTLQELPQHYNTCLYHWLRWKSPKDVHVRHLCTSLQRSISSVLLIMFLYSHSDTPCWCSHNGHLLVHTLKKYESPLFQMQTPNREKDGRPTQHFLVLPRGS